jgi:hypothetical protein
VKKLREVSFLLQGIQFIFWDRVQSRAVVIRDQSRLVIVFPGLHSFENKAAKIPEF